MSLDELIKKVSEKYVFAEDAVKTAHQAWTSYQNVIWYGPPGHAKTELALDIAKFLGQTPYTMFMNPDLDVAALFGGINIAEYRESGKMKYDFKSSFMASEFAVFDEFFDIPPETAAALKSVLLHGAYEQYGESHLMNTRSIIGCTNMKPEDWVAKAHERERDGRMATLARFPISTEIVWPGYTAAHYAEMGKKRGINDAQFWEICGLVKSLGVTLSPRDAMLTYKRYAKYKESEPTNCWLSFAYLHGMTAPIMRQVSVEASKHGKRMEVHKHLTAVEKYIDTIQTARTGDKDLIVKQLSLMARAENFLSSLRDLDEDNTGGESSFARTHRLLRELKHKRELFFNNTLLTLPGVNETWKQ